MTSTLRLDMPGDLGPPLVGHTMQCAANPPRFAMRRYQEYGPISQLQLLGSPAVLAVGGDAARAVLERQDRTFASGKAWRPWVGPFFAGGLPMLDFEEHRRHRRVLEQGFDRRRMEGYLEQLYWALNQDLVGWKPWARVRAEELVRTTVLRAEVRIFMGGGLGAEAVEIERALRRCVAAVSAPLRFPYPGGTWSRGLAARRRLEELFRSRIPVMVARGGSDLFAVLCREVAENRAGFTDTDIVNHMIFMLFGGFDPVAINVVTMIRYLAEFPEWQTRCRTESFALRNREPGIDELDRLHSLDLVIKEGLRIQPPVVVLPHTTTEDTELLGYHIPSGTFVALTPYVNHRLPEYWSEPEAFDPARFDDHRREDRAHPYAWIPFGAGVHRCLGMHLGVLQMKAVMHQLLLRASWRLAPDYTPGSHWRGLPRMRNGLPVVLDA